MCQLSLSICAYTFLPLFTKLRSLSQSSFEQLHNLNLRLCLLLLSGTSWILLRVISQSACSCFSFCRWPSIALLLLLTMERDFPALLSSPAFSFRHLSLSFSSVLAFLFSRSLSSSSVRFYLPRENFSWLWLTPPTLASLFGGGKKNRRWEWMELFGFFLFLSSCIFCLVLWYDFWYVVDVLARRRNICAYEY